MHQRRGKIEGLARDRRAARRSSASPATNGPQQLEPPAPADHRAIGSCGVKLRPFASARTGRHRRPAPAVSAALKPTRMLRVAGACELHQSITRAPAGHRLRDPMIALQAVARELRAPWPRAPRRRAAPGTRQTPSARPRRSSSRARRPRAPRAARRRNPGISAARCGSITTSSNDSRSMSRSLV